MAWYVCFMGWDNRQSLTGQTHLALAKIVSLFDTHKGASRIGRPAAAAGSGRVGEQRGADDQFIDAVACSDIGSSIWYKSYRFPK